MKKMVVGLAVYLVLLAAIKLSAQQQRIPVSISGTTLSGGAKGAISSTTLLSNSLDQLVIAVDLSSNTVYLEEWKSDLSEPAYDNISTITGTQAWLLVSSFTAKNYSSKSNKVNITADMTTGDPIFVDLDGDGQTNAAALMFIGKLSLNASGVVTKVSGTLQGTLDDSVNGGSQDVILKKAKVKSTGATF